MNDTMIRESVELREKFGAKGHVEYPGICQSVTLERDGIWDVLDDDGGDLEATFI